MPFCFMICFVVLVVCVVVLLRITMIQSLMKVTSQISDPSSGLFDLKRTFGHHLAGSFFMLLSFFFQK